MLTDRTEKVSVDKALEDLDDRWFAAEAQAVRYGELYAFHIRNGNWPVMSLQVLQAQTQFIEQFGPWMQRRLAETFWIATKALR